MTRECCHEADLIARAKNARNPGEEAQDKGVHFQSTNFGFIFFQQPSVMSTWWAQSEAKNKIGLANRFVFSSARRVTQLEYGVGQGVKLEEFIQSVFRLVILHFGYASAGKIPEMTWKFSEEAKRALAEARGMASEFSQESVFRDSGVLHSCFEKLPYFWTHESAVTTMLNGIIDTLVFDKDPYAHALKVEDNAVKTAFEFATLRLARGYNVLDVEIAAGTWKFREGRSVRPAAKCVLSVSWCFLLFAELFPSGDLSGRTRSARLSKRSTPNVSCALSGIRSFMQTRQVCI